jgi:hypothetical protein
MGDAGSPHARFRRALLTQNMTLIDAAARELPQVGLDDALRILVVMASKRDECYERAAAKWAARVATERRLSLMQSRNLLDRLELLPRDPEGVGTALHALLEDR